jgi:hypothetical protein
MSDSHVRVNAASVSAVSRIATIPAPRCRRQATFTALNHVQSQQGKMRKIWIDLPISRCRLWVFSSTTPTCWRTPPITVACKWPDTFATLTQFWPGGVSPAQHTTPPSAMLRHNATLHPRKYGKPTFRKCINGYVSIPVAAQCKAWVCGHSLAGIAGSNFAGGTDVCLLLSVVCCLVEVSAMGRPLVRRSPTQRGVSECDPETSSIRRPKPTRAVEPWKKNGNVSEFMRKMSTSNLGCRSTWYFRGFICLLADNAKAFA